MELTREQSCKNCIWGGQCHEDKELFYNECDDYSPVDDYENTDIHIENRRREFLGEWFEYIEEGDDA